MLDGTVMTDAMMDPKAEDGAAREPPQERTAADADASTTTVAVDETNPPRHMHAVSTAASTPDGALAVCHGCRHWIAGYTVHAMGHAWHAKCFRCAHCATALEHVSFYEHGGRPYCHLDFHELFTRRCFHCETPIVDERFITVDDVRLGSPRSYHELHFFCASCGDPFLDPKDGAEYAEPGTATPGGSEHAGSVSSPTVSADAASPFGRPFFVHDAHAYCEACDTRLFRALCKGCAEPILHNLVRALKATWHPDCFVCMRCRRPFHGAPVFLAPDGSPCDLDCYVAWQDGAREGAARGAAAATRERGATGMLLTVSDGVMRGG
ncbi:hypothetical protein MSPP1_002952 [Malassezia sp. CBS 17886]|nr:hypothetical protein MSPP1_002952 [Malassezia sp. CBS 17886]